MIKETPPEGKREKIPLQATNASRYIKTHDFLTKNKIFFETIAASLLSLMAIIISVAQIGIATKQNNLTELQAKIAIQQAIPQFVVTARQIYDEKVQKVTENEIYVRNQGGIVQDLESDTAVFMSVTFVTKSWEQKTVEIPLNGYYIGKTCTSREGTGLVLLIQGYKNQEREIQLKDDFRRLARERGNSGAVEIKRYLRLTYRDIFGKKYTKYYFIPLVPGGEMIEEDKGKAIFERHKKNSTQEGFVSLTASKLLDHLIK
jgi:hypothetical protein